MPDFHFKSINDPVHGNIGLSEIETEIISSGAFQRLHNVKQLGLANLVFPGANYSRFAHSVGACHVAGQLLDSIQRNSDLQISDNDLQLYRLAALLHDIGHYPLSHAVEFVVSDFYKEKEFLEPSGGGDQNSVENADDSTSRMGQDDPPAFNHEGLGRKIIENDPEIVQILNRHSIAPEQLVQVFTPERPSGLTTLVSSDLDCDRLDYLLRTAHHAGLPYGDVDIGYIVSQATTDGNDQLCFKNKAIRAADHLLMSRYYDYTQLTYHKTVVGLELLLKSATADLLNENALDFSSANLIKKIQEGTWKDVDDTYLMEVLKRRRDSLATDDEAGYLRPKLDAILSRRPPKLVAASEQILDRGELTNHNNRIQQIEEKVADWSDRFEVPEALWQVWHSSIRLTKIGGKVSVGDLETDEVDEYEIQQLVRILEASPRDEPGKSSPITECEGALVKRLSNEAFFGIRLFLVFPEDNADNLTKRHEISEAIHQDLRHFPFTSL